MSRLKRNYEEEFTVPSFYGKIDTDAYLGWEKKMEFIFGCKYYTEKKKIHLAVTGFCGYALTWWDKVAKTRRLNGEPQVNSWSEMKSMMKKRFVSRIYGQQKSLIPRSSSVFYELSGHEKVLAEKDPEIASEQVILSKEDCLVDQLKPEEKQPALKDHVYDLIKAEQDGETQVLCMHVPDQTKQEEKVLGESSTQPELAHALIDQGENFQSLTCGLLTRFILYYQSSLVEHLRVVKGLQQVVFEPGGSLSFSRRSNNNQVQKTVSYKLDLQGSFTPGEQDLRSNLFEGREDGVILSSSSKQRGETGGYTFLIRSITDQNKLRRARQKLVVAKETPKLQNEYGDHYTRPPDPMQHENQVIMSIGQDLLRDIRVVLLSSHKGLVRPPPDQPARFLLVVGDLILISYQGKHKTHDEITIVEACLWSKRREAAAVAGYELIQAKRLLSLSSVCRNILRHVRDLQHFVFKPGEEVCVCENRDQVVFNRARSLELIDQGSIILQDLDLRTNPFEGREHGAILNMLKLKRSNPAYGLAKILIKAWLNGKFQGLTGMIYEVLDREKRRTLGTALKQLEQGGFISAEINMSYGGS